MGKGDLPLVEFSYNHTYKSTMKMAGFEVLYERKHKTPSYWNELNEALIVGPEWIQETTDKIRQTQEHIEAT